MANKRKAKRGRASKKVAPTQDELRTYTWTFSPDHSDKAGASITISDPPKQTGELDLIRDTIVKHRMLAQSIRDRLSELSMRIFGESPPLGPAKDYEPSSSMLARIRDEASELGDVLASASDILDKLETL